MSDSNIPTWLGALAEEDLVFLKRFLLASGSLKRLAAEYGVSYPTIRVRLDRLIDASEPPARTVPATTVLASASARHARGLRAQLAAALARTALVVHREAAASAVARSPLEGQAEGQA